MQLKDADICMILVPDELQADLYNDFLEKNLKEGAALAFCTWFGNSFSINKTKK